MALLKTKPVDKTFKVPSLAESSPEYAGLLTKQLELQANYRELRAERTKLRGAIEVEKAAGGRRVSVDVARLLGDDPEESVTALSRRVREVTNEMGHVEAAEEVLRRRIEEARGRASKTVCDIVGSEYERRLGVMCSLLKEVETARQAHDELLDDLDREDVNKAYLRPVIPFFLGDRGTGKISYFLKEARGARHNV
jgi:hypothetical protein